MWLVCPICKQPNPAGTAYCKHCWGPSLRSIKSVSPEELAEITERNQIRSKRLNTLRIVTISVFSPLLLSLAVVGYLYLATDVIFGPTKTLNSDPPPEQWSMYRRDLTHSGNNSLSVTSPEGTLKWTFTTDGPIQHSSPAVVDGIVYIGSNDMKIYALDAETGNKLWEFKTGSYIWSSPTVVDGVVYCGSNDGNLYALDASTGSELWHFQAPYGIKSSPAVADGKIYFGCDDYHIYALDATNGDLIWKFRTEGFVISSPAIADGIILFTSYRHLYAFNAENGRFRLNYLTQREIYSSPAVSSDGTVYFNCGRFLYAVKGNARNWPSEYAIRGWWVQLYVFRVAPPPPPLSGHVGKYSLAWTTPRTSRSSPAISGNTVYTCSSNRMYSIDMDSGESNWVFPTGGHIGASPAIENNTVYIGSQDGRLYAVDASNGKKLWDYHTGALSSSPAIVDGVIYVSSQDGNVYAIQ